MEKRRQKTLALTLGIPAAMRQCVLILALFAPALFGFQLITPGQTTFTSTETSSLVEVAEAAPDERDKIFAIVKSHRPDISDLEAWRVAEVILEESEKRSLDPMMVVAVIRVESGFQYTMVSPMGARGIMQIMPDTGRFLSETLSGEYGWRPALFRPESLDDPLLNIRLGVYYLHDLTKQFQNLNLALLAYNVGPGEIQNRLAKNLEFSHGYATLVLETYHHYKKSPPPTF
jgi:soluble lytic murein transglycosylase-like protein